MATLYIVILYENIMPLQLITSYTEKNQRIIIIFFFIALFLIRSLFLILEKDFKNSLKWGQKNKNGDSKFTIDIRLFEQKYSLELIFKPQHNSLLTSLLSSDTMHGSLLLKSKTKYSKQ